MLMTLYCVAPEEIEEIENKLEGRRRAMEERGLKISRKKTIYLRFNGDGNSDLNLQGENLERVRSYI